jgi:hypothetical protein
MFAARPLPGLPPYGPTAQSFPRPKAFSEGFVVEFSGNDGETWVGNFAKFWEGGETSIHTELGSRAVVVVAGGSGYLVDAEARRLVREIGFAIRHIWFDGSLQAMIVSNGLWFEAFDAEGVVWHSRRFSWDGIQNVEQSGGTLTGEAFDPMTDRWLPFCLDLKTGEVAGGSYSGPEM